MMRSSLGIIILGLLTLACTRTDQKKERLIANLWQTDTLTLYAEYEECGEWGGHRETFKIFQMDNEGLWTNYKKDTLLSCDPYLGKNRKIVKQQRIKLTKDDQEKIVAYMHSLLDKTLEKTMVGHSGEHFRIFTSDSTILISKGVHGDKDFETLRNSIVK